jgi:hypothetical protein
VSAQASPPPDAVPLHVCFSGALACSGCNPCPKCKEHVTACVIPPALMASGLNETATVLFDLVAALAARGIDPTQHLGVQVPAALRSNHEMATAFFRGLDLGWSALLQSMQVGELASQITIQPIGSVAVASIAPSPPSSVEIADPEPELRSVEPPAGFVAAPVAVPAPPKVPPQPPALTAEDLAKVMAVPAAPATMNGHGPR